MEFLTIWMPLIASSLASGLAVWNFLQSPAKENAKNLQRLGEAQGELIQDLDGRLDEAERRIDTLDTVIKQLPTRDMFHALDKELTKVAGEIGTITETLDTAKHSLQRIEGFLIASTQGRSA